MGSLTTWACDEMLDHLTSAAMPTITAVYVALFTADPTDAGTLTNEVSTSGTAYARTAIVFAAAANRAIVQNGAVTFPQATAAWGTVSHWGIMDGETEGAGNMLAFGSFTAPFAPVNGNTPTIPDGEIEVHFISTHYTATTISAAAADDSINDSANGFPLFAAGSTVYVSGFTGTPGNNAAYTVNTSTVSKITFTDGTGIVDDAAGESVRVSLSGGFTNYTVHAWLNRMFRNVAFTTPATYVALATAIINDDDVAIGDVTECTGNNYGRVLVNVNGGASPTWDLSSAGALDNTHAITFPTPSGSWGTVTSMFLIDSTSGAGNVLAYDNEGIVNQEPVASDTVQFAIGALDLSLL
jgi:hypothetical protein